jgi:hypothetical protein
MSRLRKLEDLPREPEQFFVLAFLGLDELPLLVGQHLASFVGPVLADHHERAEEDRLKGDGKRQGRPRLALQEQHPDRKEDDVHADEAHRSGKAADGVGYAVLHALGPTLGMPPQGQVLGS